MALEYESLNGACQSATTWRGKVSGFCAIARAKHYLSLTSGGLGAYSDSRGLPGVRKEVAEFIQRRDGYPSDPELIFRLRVIW